MKNTVILLLMSLIFVGCDILSFDNVLPEAAFTHKLEGAALRIDASDSKDSDGTIVSYNWDFGDGKIAAGKVANHIYTKSGSYTITLTVKDDKGAEAKAKKKIAVTVVSNQVPQAKFTYTTATLTVNVDASSSSDSDGTIASYSWDFGDGKTATGKTANHTYTAAGSYTIKLTVKDDKGAANSSSQNVTVRGPVNQVPQAMFVVKAKDLAVIVDASSSSDSDGTIISYSWDFGDGKMATGKTANHTYAAAGTYKITLKVKDDKGAENSMSQDVTVSKANVPNQAPEAKFSKKVDNLTVQVDASDSSDSDGTIVRYSWDFGDGKTATGKTANHTYAAAGSYTITLKVIDDKGAQDSESDTVTVSAANQAPEAKFSIDRDNLIVQVDASGSSDSDGTIVSYSWDFGDAKTATGKKASHNYQSEGEYTITLTVKDDKGAEHQARQKVFLEDSEVPAAKFTYIFVGRFLSVNGSHSNGNDGSITKYAWDFGDGTKKRGVISNHTYTEPGEYTIILTVTDRNGKKGKAGAEVSIR